MLEIAHEGSWASYAQDPETIANVITLCIEQIEKIISQEITTKGSLFFCPEPLAKALKIAANPIPFSEWFRRFPGGSNEIEEED